MSAALGRAADGIKDSVEQKKGALGDAQGEAIAIGLLGRGIQSSRSPAMHEGEGRRQGLRYSYTLIDFDQLGLDDADLPAVIELAERLGLVGLNVTHPFKQVVIEHLSTLAAEANAIGAVNTVVLRDGQRTGHNTDSWGFGQSFARGLPGASTRSVVLFGAGGAGAAVAYSILTGGGEGSLQVFDPHADKAADLVSRMSQHFGARITALASVDDAPRDATGLINASPVGMHKYPGVPFPEVLLQTGPWVADVVYFPQVTELVHLAGAAGCRVLAGTGMAVYQAVRAFELFTGRKADVISMSQFFHAIPTPKSSLAV